MEEDEKLFRQNILASLMSQYRHLLDCSYSNMTLNTRRVLECSLEFRSHQEFPLPVILVSKYLTEINVLLFALTINLYQVC